MRVVLDTSVLYQAMASSIGASHAILQLIRRGQVQMAISQPLFEEYQAVLLREKSLLHFQLSMEDVLAILDFVAMVGVKTDIRFLLRPNLRDEDDNIVMELAFASGASALITQNIRDFQMNSELLMDQIQVVTPSQFMSDWRKNYG